MTSDEKSNKVIARIVRCPHCGNSAEYSPRNTFRPFCSERCRLIDLGDWAEGKYTVPAKPEEMNAEELQALEDLLTAQIENTPGDDSDS
jgi:endogenous inhibitor of DNA gyrase (YacG/DUF329 family)